NFLACIRTYECKEIASREVLETVRIDGLKFMLPQGEWLLMRPSGTEPLVRIYAEGRSSSAVDELIEAGKRIATGTDVL
ncbi:MAG: hypothetical protein HGA54_09315, partial [Actinobacteria bacterium]|nr:hypothetical protein [Actinomycetota bacterium]